MRRLPITALAATLLAFTHPCAAQDPLPLPLGSLVRVRGEEPTPMGIRRYYRRGVITSVDSTHIVLHRDGSAVLDTLPFFAMNRMDIKTGQVSRPKLMFGAAAAGALVAGGVWAGIKLVGDKDDFLLDHHASQFAKIGIPATTVAGFLFGTFASRDVWKRFPVPRALHPDP